MYDPKRGRAMSIGTMCLRLLLALLCGGLIGMERENKRRAAGFRTHILVSVGAALVMVTSEQLYLRFPDSFDPGRLGAQVISGIGFLGAGTIIRQGPSVMGLTTAASLWAVSCIGLAVGSGDYASAGIATAFVYITLLALGRFERLFVRRGEYAFELRLSLENRPGRIGEVTTLLGELGVSIRNIRCDPEEEEELIVSITVRLPKGVTKELLITSLSGLPGVTVLSPEELPASPSQGNKS